LNRQDKWPSGQAFHASTLHPVEVPDFQWLDVVVGKPLPTALDGAVNDEAVAIRFVQRIFDAFECSAKIVWLCCIFSSLMEYYSLVQYPLSESTASLIKTDYLDLQQVIHGVDVAQDCFPLCSFSSNTRNLVISAPRCKGTSD
jgi:hypothetical protein